MYTFFVMCAAIGGTVLAMQFILNLIGFAGDFGDGDFGDGHAAVDTSGTVDGPGHDLVGADGSADADLTDAADAVDGGHGDHASHSQKIGYHLARYITLQTAVAFLTFFGLGGWAALESERSQTQASVIAFGTGLGFMFLVGYAFQSLRKLEQAGNESIYRTVGCRGRVYLRIPGENAGVGKATITSQGRTLELQARTPGPTLKTGTTVEVHRVLDRQTVEVLPVESIAETIVSP